MQSSTSGNTVFTTIAANLVIWMTNLPLSLRAHTTLLAFMCRAMPFSARAQKKHFLWRWRCGKQIEMWFIVVCTLIENEYSFPKLFFVLFLHIKRVCKSVSKESLTSTSNACTFKSASVFSIVDTFWQRFLSLSLIMFLCLVSPQRFDHCDDAYRCG